MNSPLIHVEEQLRAFELRYYRFLKDRCSWITEKDLERIFGERLKELKEA